MKWRFRQKLYDRVENRKNKTKRWMKKGKLKKEEIEKGKWKNDENEINDETII